MRRLISVLLSFIIVLCNGCINIFAEDVNTDSGINIIYDIINKKPPKENNTVNDLLLYLNSNKYNEMVNKEDNKKPIKEETIIKPSPKDDRFVNIQIKDNDKDSYVVGLDISKWNGKIDWQEIKDAGVKFVIIRAGYGTTHIDSYFETNIKNAIANNMDIGIYWFSYAYNNDLAKKEAQVCLRTIEKYKEHITLPVFYDFEYDSVYYANRNGVRITKARASSYADIFCTTIQNAGWDTGIYTNIDYANNYFSKDVLSKYYTWIAQWTSLCTYSRDFILWQCTDAKFIGGKKFDLNRFYYNRLK